MNYSSKLIEQAVLAFSKFPGVGRKSALRMVLFLAKQDNDMAESILNPLLNMKEHLHKCQNCNNFSDEIYCNICNNKNRDHSTICVVESAKDVMHIEETGQYKGVYHVLGGVIKPEDGIGPDDLSVDKLMKRIEEGEVSELIMALSPTIPGDTTIHFLRKIVEPNIKITTIARGVAFGGELEYVDDITLGRSILARTAYDID